MTLKIDTSNIEAAEFKAFIAVTSDASKLESWMAKETKDQ